MLAELASAAAPRLAFCRYWLAASVMLWPSTPVPTPPETVDVWLRFSVT